MKDKKDSKPKSDEPDFESLYYQAMKENVLLKDNRITLEFNQAEINFLREVMFEELFDIRDRSFVTDEQPEDAEERKLLQLKVEDKLLKELMDQKRELIETIIKKLRFEI